MYYPITVCLLIPNSGNLIYSGISLIVTVLRFMTESRLLWRESLRGYSSKASILCEFGMRKLGFNSIDSLIKMLPPPPALIPRGEVFYELAMLAIFFRCERDYSLSFSRIACSCSLVLRMSSYSWRNSGIFWTPFAAVANSISILLGDGALMEMIFGSFSYSGMYPRILAWKLPGSSILRSSLTYL